MLPRISDTTTFVNSLSLLYNLSLMSVQSSSNAKSTCLPTRLVSSPTASTLGSGDCVFRTERFNAPSLRTENFHFELFDMFPFLSANHTKRNSSYICGVSIRFIMVRTTSTAAPKLFLHIAIVWLGSRIRRYIVPTITTAVDLYDERLAKSPLSSSASCM